MFCPSEDMYSCEAYTSYGASEGISLENAVALILALETVEEDSSQTAPLHRRQQRSVEEDLSLSQRRPVRIPHQLECWRPDLFHMLSGSSTGHENLRVFGRTLERDGRLCARHVNTIPPMLQNLREKSLRENNGYGIQL